MSEKRKTLVRIWSGTPVHQSIDTRQHMALVEKIQAKLEEKADAIYEGDFSVIEVFKDKKALVTHQARGGYRYPFTPAQTDIEAIIMDMHDGKLPSGIKLYVTAHKHTVAGSMEYHGIKILRCPAFVGFIPYAGSLTMLPHYLSDIGAWIIIITKDGRIKLQEWLYPSCLYNEDKDELIMGDKSEKSYVDTKQKTIEEPLISLLKEASKVILVLADLHIGELSAVCSESFEDGNGIIRKNKLTKANEKLLYYWKHLCYMTKTYFKPDEIWLVGDVFSGQMTVRFEKTRRMTISNIDDQTYTALELIKQLIQ